MPLFVIAFCAKAKLASMVTRATEINDLLIIFSFLNL